MVLGCKEVALQSFQTKSRKVKRGRSELCDQKKEKRTNRPIRKWREEQNVSALEKKTIRPHPDFVGKK